ncbi:Flp family type IVb pilin [Paraburkholderia sp. UYCP14C]|uniref:Flp family type IVb pilin n=1 Tax=Paraburkholderia sp. UYCP14C TaxID=2511130 RepID=UPI0010205BE8|nr:Flp family type IVb pilin [Paraburkholderia sp. UYCP14C]RZF25049.1 Flp family type IVb pilin [Paraburkholderia sp. UYCP14C]
MKNIIATAARFVRDEDGVTAIEYGLLAGLISLLIISGATALGSNLQKIFNNLASSV